MTLATKTLTESFIMSQPMPEGHKEVWQYLLDNRMRYPRNIFIPPMRRPQKSDKKKELAIAEFEAVESSDIGFPRIVRLRVHDRRGSSEVCFDGGPSDTSRLARELFTFRTRGRITIFRYGNARDFRLMAQQYIPELLAMGFIIQPINAGSELIALKVRKNGHSWVLADWEKATGIEPTGQGVMCPFTNGVKCACIKCLEVAYAALHTIQNWLHLTFGVSLKITIGTASIRAAMMCLPKDLWKWKPHPLLVTMCRLGGAFRGGLISGRGYRGPTWMVDTNRLYTWCLTRELPQSSTLSQSVIDGVLRPGIYVCTVKRSGSYPAYLPVWRDRTGGFSVQYWRGDACYTVLPTSEIEGLRAIGYTVETGFGFQFIRTWNMGAYVEKLLDTVRTYGTNHTFSRITKPMGNSVYGKFAESPNRIDTCFSIRRPGDDYFPFIDTIGTEIENLWERKHVRYASHQHVDIATTITGYARNHMYHAITAIRNKGGIIAATNTDSIITNIDPHAILEMDGSTIGKWRSVAYDPDGITVARNAWAVGEHIALSGAPAKDRRTIELIARRNVVVMHGIRKGPLLPGGPIYTPYVYTNGGSASIADQDSPPKSCAPIPRETVASFGELHLGPLLLRETTRETLPPTALSSAYPICAESG